MKSMVSTSVAAPSAPAASVSFSGIPNMMRSAAVSAVSSLKRTVDGTLKLVSHRVIAATEVTSVPEVPELPQTVEQVLASFLQQANDSGWDEGYTEMFWDAAQGIDDLEVGSKEGEGDKRRRETGLGVSSFSSRSSLVGALTYGGNRRTGRFIDGRKTLTSFWSL